MAGIIPVQQRVVDPFASYGSNVVNKLTQIVTHDSEGMLTVPSLQVELDTLSPTTTVVVKPGYTVKDDVLINLTEDHQVDFTEEDNWVTEYDVSFTGGYCYLVLQYEYAKQRPAPQATIRILQPDERSELDAPSIYTLLKVVRLDSSSPHDIIGLYDYDPGYPQYERKYIKYYAGGETQLPTFTRVRDQGRIAYESDRDKFFFGHDSEWSELTAGGVSVNVNTDTTGVFVGQLCYVDSLNQAQPAISTSVYTSADMIVTAIGQAIGVGQGIVSGFGQEVPVETGINISPGDILYLSETTAGTVTNERPTALYQMVGRALKSGDDSEPVDMIFSPKLPLASSVTGTIDSWSVSGGGLYYREIDVSALDGTNVFDCHWFDDATQKEVTPYDVEIISGGSAIRVYFPTNTLVINYMIQSPSSGGSGGGGGGGGGGGTSDHSLLLNLDYGSSGHTGFAPTPHGNADHSDVYINSTAVNYTNLNVNGSVGTGASQVAQGNHTHPTYIDIPTGEIILFESNVAVTGYTLLVDDTDGIVYYTSGSGAGGDVGGSLKGTWTQDDHNHSISNSSSHIHTTGSLALSVAQMPAHTHTYTTKGPITGNTLAGGDPNSVGNRTLNTSSAGSGSTHNHGSTGSGGVHAHGGSTQNSATPNTWRPRGRNYTRQQRN